MDAAAGFLCGDDDQLVVPPLIIGVLEGAVFTVLEESVKVCEQV